MNRRSCHVWVLGVGMVLATALVSGVVRAAGAQPRPTVAATAEGQTGSGDSVPTKPVNAARTKPATAAPGSCVECHADVSKHQVLHPKLADCASCHVQPKDNSHSFADKQCVACHQMKGPKDKFVHGPVAAGDCLTCHNPHGSEEPQLVRAFGAELCQSCHVDMKATVEEKRFVHEPVKEDCSSCHNPHASPVRYQLRQATADQCFACHKTLKPKIAAARVKHDAVTIDRQCVNCHDPHAGDFAKQLRATTMDLCLKCHDREQETPSGKVQNIKGWLEAHTDLHGPIREQDCVGCHNPHESQHFRLLRREYPAKFYTPFDPKAYELCFMCHEPDLVKVEKTTTLTGFRNGDSNLHFVHVNQAEKGRTCRACHEAHSSSSAKHVRETVPFGSWELPVKYEISEKGGSCAPGCHVPRAYDRVTPVINDTTTTTESGAQR